MQIMNVQQCGFSQKTYVKIILSALVLIFFLCENKKYFPVFAGKVEIDTFSKKLSA